MVRCALVLLLALASCASVWRGKALEMYEQYLADNPDLSLERKWLIKHDKMRSGVTTEADFCLLFHLQYGRPHNGPRERLITPVRLPADYRWVRVNTFFVGVIPYHFNGGVLTDQRFLEDNWSATGSWLPNVEPGWPE